MCCCFAVEISHMLLFCVDIRRTHSEMDNTRDATNSDLSPHPKDMVSTTPTPYISLSWHGTSGVLQTATREANMSGYPLQCQNCVCDDVTYVATFLLSNCRMFAQNSHNPNVLPNRQGWGHFIVKRNYHYIEKEHKITAHITHFVQGHYM